MNKEIKKKDAISYSGSIKVTVKNKNKVCSVKYYHNSGKWPLFNFISQCLAGNYKEADVWRPSFLDLYNAGKPGTLVPEELSLSNQMNEVPIILNSAPDIQLDKTKDTCSVVYKFIVPLTYLDLSNELVVNLLALNSKASRSGNSGPNAYFYVADKQGDEQAKLSNIIDAELAAANKNSYNLFIEWTLTFENVTEKESEE